YRYGQRDIVADRAVIYAAEESHVSLNDRENPRAGGFVGSYSAETSSLGADGHERKSILRGSGRGSEVRRQLWLSPRYGDLLHTKSLDSLGNHPRNFGVAVCELPRSVSVIESAMLGCRRSEGEAGRRHSLMTRQQHSQPYRAAPIVADAESGGEWRRHG